MNWKLLIFILVVGYGAYQHFHSRPVWHGPGVTAPNEPRQVNLANSTSIAINGYQLQPLADFDIEARVLSVQHYRFDREAELSPVDLVLGWGPMSDESVLKTIDISQGNRFYFWRVQNFIIPREDIATHSANMHMIPADSRIADALHSIRPGQIVSLHGMLVEATASNGQRWRSSLTRSDTGNGACELVYVQTISVK